MIGGWSGSEQVQCAVVLAVAPAANGLMAAAVAAAWRGVARAVVDQSRLRALQRLDNRSTGSTSCSSSPLPWKQRDSRSSQGCASSASAVGTLLMNSNRSADAANRRRPRFLPATNTTDIVSKRSCR